MNVVLEVAQEVQALCVERGWRFCFIGGLAVQMWGEPRVTDDADLTLFTGFGGEEPFIDALLARFEPRHPDAREFAHRRRVLLLRSTSGVGIDVAMGAFPFEESSVARARDLTLVPGCVLRLCTAEDFIVYKTFAARALDWHDVEMTIVRQGAKLDWHYIREQLRPLLELKEAPELLDELERLRERVARED